MGLHEVRRRRRSSSAFCAERKLGRANKEGSRREVCADEIGPWAPELILYGQEVRMFHGCQDINSETRSLWGVVVN